MGREDVSRERAMGAEILYNSNSHTKYYLVIYMQEQK